jgi:hypothetical protein
MTMAGDDDSFLARWSKRKQAVRRGETPPEPARSESPPPEPVPPPAAAPAAPAELPPGVPAELPPGVPAELPPVDSLKGLESEYGEFLRPEVDPATKSAALRKLFGDPHFNKMDGLDIYIDDYTKEDPIPAAMLRALHQARSLGLFDDAEKEKVPGQGAPEPAAPAPVAALEQTPTGTVALPAEAEPKAAVPPKPDPV